MDVDVSTLSDDDLAALKRGYAAGSKDDTVSPRLRTWAWTLALALTEELERREEILRALCDDLDPEGGVGEQIRP